MNGNYDGNTEQNLEVDPSTAVAEGDDLFIKLYIYLIHHTCDDCQPDFVPSDKVMYVSRVLKIIYYENQLFK